MGQKGLRSAILFIGVVIFMAGYMPWANYTMKQYFKDFVFTLDKGYTPADFDKLEAQMARSLQRMEGSGRCGSSDAHEGRAVRPCRRAGR